MVMPDLTYKWKVTCEGRSKTYLAPSLTDLLRWLSRMGLVRDMKCLTIERIGVRERDREYARSLNEAEFA